MEFLNSVKASRKNYSGLSDFLIDPNIVHQHLPWPNIWINAEFPSEKASNCKIKDHIVWLFKKATG